MEKLRVFEAFSGIGTQSMALDKIGINYEVVAISEIDKFVIKSYNAIHGKVLNLGDISKVNVEDIPDHDLFTYSFPCQDISIAGKQEGLDESSGTRSSLLWECNRVIENVKPKYLLLENVKNLVGKRHKDNFDRWLEHLEELGYTNYWKVLNAKDFGIPQNRERVFVVSILGEHNEFIFPNVQDLDLRLKDMLEDEVNEKYYLKSEKSKELLYKILNENEVDGTVTCDASVNSPKIKDISNCITARYDAGIQNKQSMGMSVIDSSKSIDIINPLKGKSGNGWHFEQQVYSSEGITRAVKAGGGSGNIPKVIEDVPFRIRKLTPLECWRLMGIPDSLFYKAQKVNSNTQLYKQAGNAIVVNVLEGIFKNMFADRID